MTKKELRKNLELLLVKVIEDVLNKSNAEASQKIRKTTYEASKLVAKKFYKSIKEKPESKLKKRARPQKKIVNSKTKDATSKATKVSAPSSPLNKTKNKK